MVWYHIISTFRPWIESTPAVIEMDLTQATHVPLAFSSLPHDYSDTAPGLSQHIDQTVYFILRIA